MQRSNACTLLGTRARQCGGGIKVDTAFLPPKIFSLAMLYSAPGNASRHSTARKAIALPGTASESKKKYNRVLMC